MTSLMDDPVVQAAIGRLKLLAPPKVRHAALREAVAGPATKPSRGQSRHEDQIRFIFAFLKEELRACLPLFDTGHEYDAVFVPHENGQEKVERTFRVKLRNFRLSLVPKRCEIKFEILLLLGNNQSASSVQVPKWIDYAEWYRTQSVISSIPKSWQGWHELHVYDHRVECFRPLRKLFPVQFRTDLHMDIANGAQAMRVQVISLVDEHQIRNLPADQQLDPPVFTHVQAVIGGPLLAAHPHMLKIEALGVGNSNNTTFSSLMGYVAELRDIASISDLQGLLPAWKPASRVVKSEPDPDVVMMTDGDKRKQPVSLAAFTRATTDDSATSVASSAAAAAAALPSWPCMAAAASTSNKPRKVMAVPAHKGSVAMLNNRCTQVFVDSMIDANVHNKDTAPYRVLFDGVPCTKLAVLESLDTDLRLADAQNILMFLLTQRLLTKEDVPDLLHIYRHVNGLVELAFNQPSVAQTVCTRPTSLAVRMWSASVYFPQ